MEAPHCSERDSVGLLMHRRWHECQEHVLRFHAVANAMFQQVISFLRIHSGKSLSPAVIGTVSKELKGRSPGIAKPKLAMQLSSRPSGSHRCWGPRSCFKRCLLWRWLVVMVATAAWPVLSGKRGRGRLRSVSWSWSMSCRCDSFVCFWGVPRTDLEVHPKQ